MGAPLPPNELERLQALHSYQVLDTPPEKVFDDVARIAASICGVESALVSLVDNSRQWFKARVGWPATETPRDLAFCAHAILSPELMVVPDTLHDERFAANPLVTSDPHIRFYAGMPLVNSDGHALGTLCVIDKQPRKLKPEQEDALRVLAAGVMTHFELRRAFRELETYRTHLEEIVEKRTKQLLSAAKRIELTYDETLSALGGALDLRDNETAGHSRRVTQYCLEIARIMGSSEADLKQIERGSYLHDIGKIGIPDAILFKPGKLNDEEKKIMESHARIGYDLVSGIAFLAPAAQIVLAHQERFDGMGYPQGLVGHEIPLGARIFTVADTLDAMTSDRPYRRAMTFEAASEEIKFEAGHQFDPKVVEAFLSVPVQMWMQIRADGQDSRNSLRRINWQTK